MQATARMSLRRTVGAVASPLRAGSRRNPACIQQSRSLFGFGEAKKTPQENAQSGTAKQVLLTQDNLFHMMSTSPIPEIRAKAERVKAQAFCPVSLSQGVQRHVAYDCPYSGWPTHYSRTEWESDSEHGRYWPRLKEANEDEHDLRSGRELGEFMLPGQQPYEEAISMANWDVFFYTRGFPSIESDRSRRHVSKLLTFPTTIASVLHENSPYSLRNQRLTPEGLRSLTALRQALHPAQGAKPSITGRPLTPLRIFVLGARAESSLPPHVWQQLSHLFPESVSFHIYFIGPEVALPDWNKGARSGGRNLHNVKEVQKYGAPAQTTYVSESLSLTSIRAKYDEVHNLLDSFDPYNDCFFSFSPGFGFPDEHDPSKPQASTNWSTSLSQILSTKCPLFATGFSPKDVERDVLALDALQTEGIKGEFDWILTPGENVFSSQKWEILEQDPRVAAKANWGLWGIRGKLYELSEEQRLLLQ